MKLVIVDDLAINRKLLRVTLEAEGHTTLEAADGVEALQILAREKVDAVLTDILMPRMDGYRLCHEIRTDDRLRELPIIVYTSTYTSLSDEKLAFSLGADKYLKKPAPAGTILTALHEAIGRQHSAPRPEAWQEVEVLKQYSDRLVTKLEERNIELEYRLRLAALSLDVSSALMHGGTLREILQRCAQALVQHIDASLAHIWIHNQRAGVLELQASAGMYTHIDGPLVRVPLGESNIGLIAEQRKPHFNNSIIGDPHFPEQEWVRLEGLIAFAGYPLIVGDRMVGVMAMFARDSLSPATLDKMASIADMLALGIERKRLDEELRSALAEKVTLLQEVHHRVNNNLQIICGLLSMPLATCPDGNPFSERLKVTHSRVMAMALVHDQIYRSETLADLNFGGYIEALSGQLFSSYCNDPSRIRLELSVERIHLDLDHAIPCGLILNELLSNSLKHAFSDGRAGVIRISLRKSETGCVELVVADDGVGLPVDFRLEESKSLGLQMVRTLIHRLDGDVFVTGEGGAKFTLSIKIPEADNLPADERGDHLIQ